MMFNKPSHIDVSVIYMTAIYRTVQIAIQVQHKDTLVYWSVLY